MAQDNCIFCKIISGEVPSFKLLETDLHVVFLDIYPLAEGHALIVPKYHAEKLHQVPDEYLTDVLSIAKKVAVAIGCADYNILQNNGARAHQAALHVKHVHFHVIPKPDNDEEGLLLSGTQKKATPDQLGKLQADIKSKL